MSRVLSTNGAWWRMAASIVAVAFALGAMSGAFGGWTSSDTANQGVQAGVVNLGLGAGQLSTGFGSTDSPFGPGDSGVRTFSLANTADSALALANLTIQATPTVSADSASPVATAEEVAASFTILIEQCSIAWSGGSCAGSKTTVVSSRAMSALTAAPVALNIGGDATLAKGATAYLQLTMTVVASPPDAVQGVAGSISWSFTGGPRTAQTGA